MSILKRALKQSSTYMFFQGVGMSVSLITFPILTRVFSVETYGNLALANAVLLLLISFAKCGVTTSFIRHYSEIGSVTEEKTLYSSTLTGTSTVSMMVVLIYYLALFLLKDKIEDDLIIVFLVLGAMLIPRNINNLFSSFFRAEGKVLILSTIGLISKFGAFCLGILVYLTILKSLPGFFIGTTIFEYIIMCCIFLYFYRRKVLEVRVISFNLTKKIFIFGFPLIFYEIASLINDYADRFLIKYFLGSSQLGIYSVGYNFSMYAQGLITAPLWMSIFPIYTKLWEKEGKEETVKFLETLLKYYCCMTVLIVFGVSLLSDELIIILASEKYVVASKLIPLIMISIMVHGSYHICGAAFFLFKKTRILATYTVLCALINIALNIYFIPKYGIMGAVYATVFSYGVLTITITYNANRLLKIAWPIKDIIYYLFFATLTYLLLINIKFVNMYLDVFIRSIMLVFVYVSLIVLYDGQLRRILRRKIPYFK